MMRGVGPMRSMSTSSFSGFMSNPVLRPPTFGLCTRRKCTTLRTPTCHTFLFLWTVEGRSKVSYILFWTQGSLFGWRLSLESVSWRWYRYDSRLHPQPPRYLSGVVLLKNTLSPTTGGLGFYNPDGRWTYDMNLLDVWRLRLNTLIWTPDVERLGVPVSTWLHWNYVMYCRFL